MNEAETTMETAVPETKNTPNPIEGSDLERKTGGGEMEQAGSDGEGLAPPEPDAQSPALVAEDKAIRAHFDRLWQEAEAFSREVPGFDLEQALQDDAFAALLSPRRGLTLEQAFFVRHGRALLAAAERAAESRVTAALQASRRVPAPLGAAASAGFRWDPASNAEARAALKARIRKGEKIYPGR